ncbi:MAG: chemotaxis protein CheW [Sulfurimonas sp.]|jgi:chemotaxis signal transduction protein|nr:chemotaxis protein CheW [Sulfurimonas sp.]
MIDLIVFNVGSSRYALNIENIQRIIQMVELTEIPNAHDLIDGMMSYENSVVKVLNFRKVIGLPPHEDENKDLENSSLKLLFYENGSKRFAIKVDSIDDIVHIEDSQIMNSDEEQSISEYLELSGVLDLEGVLINVIKTLKIPS